MTAFNIGLLIFPGITQLDFTGPLEVFSRLSTPSSIAAPSEFPQSKTHIVGKTALPVPSDRGHSFLPTCTFGDSPSLDLICVRQKNDAADAEAICEAVTRASMRLVEIKSPEQQSIMSLHRVRIMLMRQQGNPCQ